MTHKKSLRYAALSKTAVQSVYFLEVIKKAAVWIFRVTKNAQPTSAWLSAYAALSVNAI
jgi:hypothetical protein